MNLATGELLNRNLKHHSFVLLGAACGMLAASAFLFVNIDHAENRLYFYLALLGGALIVYTLRCFYTAYRQQKKTSLFIKETEVAANMTLESLQKISVVIWFSGFLLAMLFIYSMTLSEWAEMNEMVVIIPLGVASNILIFYPAWSRAKLSKPHTTTFLGNDKI